MKEDSNKQDGVVLSDYIPANFFSRKIFLASINDNGDINQECNSLADYYFNSNRASHVVLNPDVYELKIGDYSTILISTSRWCCVGLFPSVSRAAEYVKAVSPFSICTAGALNDKLMDFDWPYYGKINLKEILTKNRQAFYRLNKHTRFPNYFEKYWNGGTLLDHLLGDYPAKERSLFVAPVKATSWYNPDTDTGAEVVSFEITAQGDILGYCKYGSIESAKADSLKPEGKGQHILLRKDWGVPETEE